MAKEKTLRDLFHDTLKDIYFAEKKILAALPKMAKAAQSEDLKAAFEKHEGETEEHVNAARAGVRGDRCKAARQDLRRHHGHHRGGRGDHGGVQGQPALDAGLLAAAQAVEHYEISRYGTLKTGRRSWAGAGGQAARRDADGREGDRRRR